MNTDNNKITFSQKLQIIETIKSLQLEHVTIEEIMELLNKLLDKHTLITFFTPDLVLHRGIPYSHKPKLYEELIYPPKDKAKNESCKYQR